ncbi:hypothetical protein J1605_010853 [Eschrichtius robustus]|uniref:Uncharacterized protein n=1 Tax=Eschrichtius robustus TaxID=9764 RepID=A0AB34GSE9_ESCRO|nr:hypothetical protein J1605_010853 [Eschrichtius robustus]
MVRPPSSLNVGVSRSCALFWPFLCSPDLQVPHYQPAGHPLLSQPGLGSSGERELAACRPPHADLCQQCPRYFGLAERAGTLSLVRPWLALPLTGWSPSVLPKDVRSPAAPGSGDITTMSPAGIRQAEGSLVASRPGIHNPARRVGGPQLGHTLGIRPRAGS